MKASVLFIFAFLASLSIGLSKKLEGVIDKSDGWVFLTRFCFLSRKGQLTYDFAYPQDHGVQNFLFYYDTPGQWESAYKKGKTCQEKVDVLNNENIFPLDARVCSTEIRNGRPWYRCRNVMGFRSSRERWWYLVIERCRTAQSQSSRGVYLQYDVHMTNGDDLLHKEFSADQFYILPVDIVFFILYIILLGASIAVAIALKKKNMYHTTYKMYLASVSIWTIALLFLVIAWGSYGNTGWERSSIEVFGRILQTSATIVFILQLILMAKGYTIVRGRLTNKAVLKIVIFICLYSVTTIALYAWEAYIFDPGLVLYYYESPPGYCMIGMQLLGWLWMTKAAVFTLKHYSSSTSKFYIPFYIIYSIWFWTGPVVTMLAMMCMEKWTREKIVHGVQQLIALLGHIFFFMLTLPCKVNANFPYSTRISQIGDLPGRDEEVVNAYSISNYVNYDGTGPNLNMFITSTNREETSFGDRMFGPLDAPAGHSNNTPPPTYLEVTASDPLPPIQPPNPDTNPKTTDFSNVSEPQPTHPPHGHLPPISQNGPTSELRLPPLRASGLPPIIPSAPSENDTDMNPLSRPPPAYSDMFQVKE